MKERQKRLIEVYEHLRRYFGIHTKTGFAEALKYGRTSLSAAMNGNEDYLTDNLFKTICESYQGVFNLDYLLTGNGTLLAGEEELRLGMRSIDPEPMQMPDTNAFIDAIIAAKNETIDTLKTQIGDLRIQLNDREKRIEDKEKQIAMLEKRIADFEAAAAFINENSFPEKWPFPPGVAEEMKKRMDRV